MRYRQATATGGTGAATIPNSTTKDVGAQPAGAGILTPANGAGQPPALTLTQKIRAPAGVPPAI